MVARHWSNALSVALTAGLGLGLTLAVFAVLNELLLRPPSYPEPDRLVLTDGLISEAELRSWRNTASAVQAVAGYLSTPVTVGVHDVAVRAQSTRVSQSFFGLLGVRPIAGRVFGEADPADGVAVAGEGLARRMFGSVESALGKRVTLDGLPVEIVGVLPALFGFPSATVEFWRPIGPQTTFRRGADGRVSVTVNTFPVLARLTPEATLDQARTEFEAVLQTRSSSEQPTLVDFQSARARQIRRPLLLLQWVVGLVLALGLCNATLLMFGHYRSRHSEFAIRVALGAGRARILRTLIGESLVVGLLASLFAAGTALLGLALLRSAIGPEASRVQLDGGLFAANLISSCVLLIVASLLAASGALRQARAFHIGVRGPAQRSRMRTTLLTTQIAGSAVLVIASVSTIASLDAASESIPSSMSRDALAADVHLVGPAYVTFDARVAFAERLIHGLAEGHLSAGVADSLPFSDAVEQGRLQPPGDAQTTRAHGADGVTTHYLTASPGYFETMAWPILRGRGLSWSDARTTTPVVVLTRSLAAERFGETDAIGQYMRFAARTWQVVGIVDDVPAAPGVRGTPTAYISFRQLPSSDEFGLRTMTVVVGGSAATTELATRLTEAARSVDPGVALTRVSPIERRFADSAAFLTFFRDLLSGLGWLVMTLAAFGLYGVVRAIVGERRSEIAVRMSLGATESKVLASVLRLGVRPVVLGLLLAVPGALIAHGALRTAVPGLLPLDLATVVIVVAIALSVSVLACLLPAIRATRIDPAILLKS